ncbi:MAG: LCP family protein [Paludibacter sp.]|nr:LCP family protein [Paludibacter sp.]
MVSRKRKSTRYSDKFKKRKALFWWVLGVLVFLLLILMLWWKLPAKPDRYIRVGICGAVRVPAVYTMRDGADLGMLVRRANGFRANADIFKVNLERLLENDTIYHIPARGNGGNDVAWSLRLNREVKNSIDKSYSDITQKVSREFDNKEIRKYSVLYVGLPAVYVLINYYPDFNRINFIHLPHSTVFLNNEYRLIDLFFTLDIYPTMRIVEHTLKQKIDYYLIQDRGMFVDLIDRLGGVELNLDDAYAQAYDLQPGRQLVDGFHAWEYIRFIDWRNIGIKVRSEKKRDLIRSDNFEANPRTWERIYEIRNQRQRYVLEGMRHSFKVLSKNQQMDVINNFKKVFNTDMDVDFLMKLYTDILSTKDFSFGNIPGYYGSSGNKLYFYPDLPNFEMLQEQEIREWLEKKYGKTQTVY